MTGINLQGQALEEALRHDQQQKGEAPELIGQLSAETVANGFAKMDPEARQLMMRCLQMLQESNKLAEDYAAKAFEADARVEELRTQGEEPRLLTNLAAAIFTRACGNRDKPDRLQDASDAFDAAEAFMKERKTRLTPTAPPL